MNTDRAKVEELTITLTDQIATLEQKYKHKEVEYDEYEKLSQFYEKQHADKVMQLLQEARINSLLDLEQWAKLHDLDKEMILDGIEHMVKSNLLVPDQPRLDHTERIKQLKEPSNEA